VDIGAGPLEQDLVVHLNGAQVARAHPDERIGRARRGLRLAIDHGDVPRPAAAPEELVGWEEDRLRRLGTRGEAEQRLVPAVTQPVVGRVLLVADAARQVIETEDGGIDDRAVTNGRSDHRVAPEAEGVDQRLEPGQVQYSCVACHRRLPRVVQR